VTGCNGKQRDLWLPFSSPPFLSLLFLWLLFLWLSFLLRFLALGVDQKPAGREPVSSEESEGKKEG
jgi:hypothetical protein